MATSAEYNRQLLANKLYHINRFKDIINNFTHHFVGLLFPQQITHELVR